MATPVREFSYDAVEIYNEETLGVGSYGKVCKAKCGQLPAAIKLLHDTMFGNNDPGIRKFVQRFEQECQFLMMIKHPNIVQFLGTSREPQSGRLGLLMELMDESLTRFLERSTGPLPYHIQLNIGQDVALALAYLHSNGIVHRDLSSNNVLLIGEGTRAKVTDFGMSTLIGMNPRMTPLTQCPGCAVYMPPEALITPPRYSNKLDCFSHGVLAIQIATRQFPNPGDAHRYINNPAYPTGQILVPFPEMERRKEHIDQVEPDHPLLPLALHCLKDRDTERPSADELCGRLASLKREPKYTHSVEQSRQQNTSLQTLQQQLQEKDAELARARANHEIELCECHQTLQQQIEEKDAELARARSNHEIELGECHQTFQQQIQERDAELTRARENHKIERGEYQAKLNQKDEELSLKEEEIKQLHKENCPIQESKPVKVNPEEVLSDPLAWRQGEPPPFDMISYWGAAVVHNNTVYFSSGQHVYAYALPEDKWSKLKPCRYEDFSMAVVNHKLTTIGGEHDRSHIATSTLLCLSGSSSEMKWEELLPPMPTERVKPTAVTTPTHLVVAGGRAGGRPQKFLGLPTVEVLNCCTLQWASASSSPEPLLYPNMVLCGELVYLSGDETVFSCSVEELIKSCKPASTNSSAGDSVWTRLPDTPTYRTTLATLRGYVLTIGGSTDGDTPTGAIHCYDRSINSWNVIGEMPTPRFRTLVAVLPSNKLVVVGGLPISLCRITEIAHH